MVVLCSVVCNRKIAEDKVKEGNRKNTAPISASVETILLGTMNERTNEEEVIELSLTLFEMTSIVRPTS